jgi:rSAM/selenodomain-associated transferase 2
MPSIHRTTQPQHLAQPSQSPATFSIIIPVLQEQRGINLVISNLMQQPAIDRAETILIDGDPEGSTLKVVHASTITKLIAPPGRAVQMNTGAARAKGRILLFLHADTQLPDNALLSIEQALLDPRIVGGAFELGIASQRLFLRYIACRANMRTRTNRIPYGDQAIFLRKSVFDEMGGYRPLPIMEDLDLMRRLKKGHHKIKILRDRVQTSARRWEAEGALVTTLRNQLLVLLYYLGVSPDKLVRLYRPQCTLEKTQDHKEEP